MADSTQTQLRRGTSSQVAAMTPAEGEVVVNTTTRTAHVGDGTTAGGNPLAKLASPAFTGTPTAPTASGGTSNTQIATTAFVAAAIGAIPPATGMPAAVTGSLTTGSTATLTVDFTTYSAYDILVSDLTLSSGTAVTIQVSTNGGTSYIGGSRINALNNGSSVSAGNLGYEINYAGTASTLVGTITQGSASGGAGFAYTSGDGLIRHQSGVTTYAASAAVNRVQLATAGAFATGTVVLQPKALR